MMHSHQHLIALVVLAGVLPAQDLAEAAKPPEYWPGTKWETVDPAVVGLDATKLAAARKHVFAHKSTSFLVLRKGRIVLEAYGKGGGREVPRGIASATKSMTSILVGMAIDRGKLRMDQSIAAYLPSWQDTDKAAITLRHLLSMTSGLKPLKKAQRRPPGDQFIHNASMPVEARPGGLWKYNTPAYHMLFRIIETATEMELAEWTREHLLTPLGMKGSAWNTRQSGQFTNYFNLSCTARDMGRFGLFVMRGGRWGDAQLVSKKFFASATTPSQQRNPAYGLLFWLNAKKGHSAGGRRLAYRFPGAPRDPGWLGAPG